MHLLSKIPHTYTHNPPPLYTQCVLCAKNAKRVKYIFLKYFFKMLYVMLVFFIDERSVKLLTFGEVRVDLRTG